ncbi:unnamed protein product [Thelazia callipaeda]|uniref:Probable cytosolic iron-sulfur protein assembly protein CIAO1 homolog n=1 Tax=Thelazia callipaeda TaxID=103827 RepID=A0A0N5CLU7_THECL|nr:unnamed protein product [Thelazia callipaeda]
MITSRSKFYHSCDLACRVWCVQWNHAGTVLASCGEDKNIKLWTRIDVAPYLKYSGTIGGSHSRTIRYITFSPSDKFMASASFDSTIVVYQLYNDYEEISRLEGHESEVKCCAFSPSGDYLATCSRDKTVWFWQYDEKDFEVGSILQSHTQDVKFVVWHPVHDLLVSCSYDCSIRFYRFDGEDWITNQKIDNAHESTVWAADFSHDGSYLVTVGADSIINVHEINNSLVSQGKWIKVISMSVESKWPLYTVSWSKIHGIIAVGGGDRKLRSFYKQLFSVKILDSEINSLIWNPADGNLLAGATDDGEIHLFHISL